MHKRFLRMIAIGLLLSGTTAAFAGQEEDYNACDSATLENVLDVCSKVANDLGQSAERRALAHANLSWGYSENKEYEKAIDSATASIKLNDSDTTPYNNRGFSKSMLGRNEEAIADFGEAIKRDPKNTRPLINRGEIYFKRGDFQKAMADYSLVIKADPKNVDGWNNRGAALLNLKQNEGALADLNQAIKLDPKYVLPRANRVEVYYNLGQSDKALKEAESIVEKFPDNGDAYNVRGWIKQKTGNLEGALADVDKALAISPDDAAFRDTRGAVYLALKRYQDAVAEFSKAIAIYAENTTYYRQRAEAKLGLSDLEGARADAEKALSLKPDDADNLKTMNGIQAAMLSSGNRQVSPDTTVQPQKKVVAPAGRRVALVIGNSAYPDGMALPNPVNDAKAIAAALTRLGFDVVLATDASKTKMSDAMYQFAVKAEGADAAMVFYAGHGMQVDGENYLMPVDGSVETQADLKHKFVAAKDILDDLRTVKGMRMVVLDACRNNPLSRSIKLKLAKVASRAVDNRDGLADMKAEGVLIAFATQPNEVAADGDGVNSPFTVALLKHIETPNIEVDTMFKRVRTTAAEMTDGTQLPQTVNSSTGEFYLKAE